MKILRLFDSGMDTYDISRLLHMRESEVAKQLRIEREARLRRMPNYADAPFHAPEPKP